MKNIDADYYGYRDEDDGVLVPLEKEAEKEGSKHLGRVQRKKYRKVPVADTRGGGGDEGGRKLPTQ